MLVDTHCHLTYPALFERIDAVVSRAHAAGVERMITVATDPLDARAALPLLERHPSLYLAAGIHPHEAAKVGDDELQALAALHRGRWSSGPAAGRLVALGEIGLDFHYDFAPRDVQERIFREQLSLAIEVGRPVIIHARESESRVCAILAEYREICERTVFHCFSGGPELAKQVLDLGCWLSFTGVATFRNAGEIRAAAAAAPADRIMVETDAPYLSPEPHRKVRPNEPALVVHTARRIADERGTTYEAFAAQTTHNAERFFGLGAE
ncbi:MAG: TatD family deoxyribonuclease [Planctomycetota bacterium]|nr:MAG: TatD family deoxyribonuclease [Planctomycetota bacterium]